MGIGNWFLKQPREEFDTEEVEITEQIENISDINISIEEKVKSSTTEKFNNFLNQLDVLKSVEGLDESSRYKVALATTQITIDEIKENIETAKVTINNEIRDFEFSVKTNTTNKEEAIRFEITEYQRKMDEAVDKINELNNEIKILGEKINESNVKVENIKVDAKEKIDSFQSSTNDLRNNIVSLESTIEKYK